MPPKKTTKVPPHPINKSVNAPFPPLVENKKTLKETLKALTTNTRMLAQVPKDVLESYNKMSDLELFEETTRVLEELEMAKTRKHDTQHVALNEAMLLALRRCAQKKDRHTKTQQPGLYPDIENGKFAAQIARKKEFAKSAYQPYINVSNSFDALVKERCNIKGAFRLSPNQTFIKNFLSPNTPYKSLLLFHSVGVGKTATAISIAENFRSVYNKKTLVILPTNLKENFKSQLFNVAKLLEDESGHNQVVAANYLAQVTHDRAKDKLGHAEIEKRVHRLINDNYEFWGFLEFANAILREKRDIDRLKKRAVEADAEFANRLRDMFSNRVIIIDEVHNIRADGDTQKITPPILKKVMQHAENTKLVILSATPMFNKATEIIQMLNLLLANEKRPEIDEKTIFMKNDHFTPQGKDLLAHSCQGLVSYMRGENPFSFPQRLYPSINKDERVMDKRIMPTKSIFNKSIPEEDILANQPIEIIQSEMTGVQSTAYAAYEAAFSKSTTSNSSDSEESESDEEDTEEETEDESHGTSDHNSKPTQAANIVFPKNNQEDPDCGQQGFFNCFEKQQPSKTLKVKYKNSIYENHGAFLNIDNIHNFGAKIKTIVDYILKSRGIVFVYSYYIYSALVPLAIALEHAGFQKYGGDNILVPNSSSDIASPRYIENTKNRATYSILTRNQLICPNLQHEINAITSSKNMRGEVVKVVLGTSVSAEGIDFKRIREVHILEPWYHLNKIEQVIGRAIRTCSHTALPPEERNVTVYHHAATLPVQKRRLTESVDLWRYRIATTKQRAISAVETTLKENAVDCILNQPVSYYKPEDLNIKLNLETSQRRIIKNFYLGDGQSSRYEQVQCKGVDAFARDELGANTSTFRSDFYLDDVGIYTEYMARVFVDFAESLTLNELEDRMKANMKHYDTDVGLYALTEVIQKRVVFTNPSGMQGHIVYSGDKYVFVPIDNPFSYITKNMRNKVDRLITKRVFVQNKAAKRTLNKPENAHNKKQSAQTQDWGAILQERLASLIKNDLVDNENISKLNKYLLDFIIDRCPREELLQIALFAHSTHTKNQFAADIYQSLQNGGYVQEFKRGRETVTFVITPYEPTIPYMLTQTQIQKASPIETREILEGPLFAQFKARYVGEAATMKLYKGFLATDCKTCPAFKVLGEKEKSTGCICEQTSSIKVDMLRDEITRFDDTLIPTAPKRVNKEQLCKLFELVIRAKVLVSDNQNREFLRPLEYHFLTKVLPASQTDAIEAANIVKPVKKTRVVKKKNT